MTTTNASEYLQIPAESEGSLHRKDQERDSCGVGVVCHIKGERSHRILELGVTSVSNVTHRGALNADGKTGDGAGVTTQIPYEILLPEAEKLGTKLEDEKDLAVGVFFLPKKEHEDYAKARTVIEARLRARGFGIIGWREEVPMNVGALGDQALQTLPEIEHLLIQRPANVAVGDEFERALYLARRDIRQHVKAEEISRYYAASLSSRLMSYKAFLVASALNHFYLDLVNPDYKTAICLYHQRFSTNTFPTWALAQPFRMLAHNGEINTLRGNRNWLNSRIGVLGADVWSDDDLDLLQDVIDPNASDSASLDNALELLTMSGRSLVHTMAMLVPPAWRIDPFTTEAVADFYKYHSCFCEPWDGPAALAYTNGTEVAASLDRNGLRPIRYKVTSDGVFSLASEAGTCYLPDETVIEKGRLAPGEMILINTAKGTITRDQEIKEQLAAQAPYGQWLKEQRINFAEEVATVPNAPTDRVPPD